MGELEGTCAKPAEADPACSPDKPQGTGDVGTKALQPPPGLAGGAGGGGAGRCGAGAAMPSRGDAAERIWNKLQL